MSASSVKTRELVPVRRTIIGEVELVNNVVLARLGRGEVVQLHKSFELPDGRVHADLTLMEPRPRWLARVRTRAVERVWPEGEPATARALRVLAYAAGMVLGAVVGFLTYEAVLAVIWLYEFIRYHFASIVAVVFLVGLVGSVVAGAGACAHRCGIHH